MPTINISPNTLSPDQKANFQIKDAPPIDRGDANTWLTLQIASPSGAAGMGITMRSERDLHVRLDPTVGNDDGVERGTWTAKVYNLRAFHTQITGGPDAELLAVTTFSVHD